MLADVRLALGDATTHPTSRPAGSGYHILVVDDEPVNVQALVNYLSLWRSIR